MKLNISTGLVIVSGLPIVLGNSLNRRIELSNRRVRARKVTNDLCDPKVNQEAGTINVKGRDMFYWYFPSRDTPEEDPVILYTGGVPGKSSIMATNPGMFPCTVNSKNASETIVNPYSWNEKANLVILDQYPEVGFTPVDNANHVSSESLSKDTVYFLDDMYRRYPSLVGRPIHIVAESFGAHAAIKMANIIRKRNLSESSKARHKTQVESIAIGYGVINPMVQLKLNQEHCMPRNFNSLSDEYCRCTRFIDTCLTDSGNDECYDGKYKCIAGLSYLGSEAAERDAMIRSNNLMNSESTVKQLGLAKGTLFNPDSLNAAEMFSNSWKLGDSAEHELKQVLSQGTRVLLYSGNRGSRLFNADNLLRYLKQQNNLYREFLPEGGAEKYAVDLIDRLNGHRAGKALMNPASPLAWAVLDNPTNHKGPGDRPDIVQSMINRWVRKLQL